MQPEPLQRKHAPNPASAHQQLGTEQPCRDPAVFHRPAPARSQRRRIAGHGDGLGHPPTPQAARARLGPVFGLPLTLVKSRFEMPLFTRNVNFQP